MSAEPVAFTVRPPDDLASWARLFELPALPVLAETADALESLREHEDRVDARLIAETISSDPLMILKVLGRVASVRSRLRSGDDLGSVGTDTETVTAAVVMLGISPFFKAFGAQRSVQDQLATVPGAVEGFMSVLQRSRRAARFAAAFAVHRMDTDAEVLQEAALLHDFAELLLWLQAPALADELTRRQAADRTLRSSRAQCELLNVELPDLEQVLMRQWRLPHLLLQTTDDRANGASAQMRNVRLAVRLARHSAREWDNPALADDIGEIAALLNLSDEAAGQLVRRIDGD